MRVVFLKKLCLIIFFFSLFSYNLSYNLWGQDLEQIVPSKQFPVQIDDINYILNSIQNSFQKAIIEGTIPNDVSVTKIATYGFRENQAEYINNILEAIFIEDIGFRIIKIDKAFSERRTSETGSGDRVKGIRNNSEYFEITKEAGNSNFIEFYFYRFKNKILARVFIHDAKSTKVLWDRRWSVETKESNFVFNIFYTLDLASFNFNTSFINSEVGGTLFYPLGRTKSLLGFFLGGRQVGFGDYGAVIKLGASYTPFELANSLELNALLFIGPKLALNLFELSDWSQYPGLNLYLTIEGGILLDSAIIVRNNSRLPFIPTTLFSSSLGFELTFESSYIVGVYFDFFQFDVDFSVGLRF